MVTPPTRAKFVLDASEGRRELGRGGRATLDLGESLVEDLGDVEETDDVALLVADRLKWRG